MREGTLFTDHVWTVHGQNAVQVGNLLGGDKIIKPGQCLSTGGIFGKPVFAPKQAKLPTPSPHTSPESFVDAAAPTPGRRRRPRPVRVRGTPGQACGLGAPSREEVKVNTRTRGL